MKPASLVPAAALAMALAACGGDPAPAKDGNTSSSPPFGVELAAADLAPSAGASVRELAPGDVARELARGTIRLIDIRTDAELAEDPAISGAEHIPMDQLSPTVLENTDGREVVLYCRSGRRSEMAATKLAEEAGQAVTHMPGGILAWQELQRAAPGCSKAGGDSC